MKIFSVSGLPISVSSDVVYVIIDENEIKAKIQLDERFKDFPFTLEERKEYEEDVKLTEISLENPRIIILF
jgi:hypothetical protein